MMKKDLKLVEFDDNILLEPCSPLTDIKSQARTLLPRLYQSMIGNRGIIITANQLGESLAMFVTNIPGDHIRIFINPEIVETSAQEMASQESCISMPGQTLRTKRKRHVVIRAFNMSGEEFTLDTADSMYPTNVSIKLSACIQHAMDHLRGIDMREYL